MSNFILPVSFPDHLGTNKCTVTSRKLEQEITVLYKISILFQQGHPLRGKSISRLRRGCFFPKKSCFLSLKGVPVDGVALKASVKGQDIGKLDGKPLLH